MADDLVQLAREAIGEIVDSHSDIIAITGRDRENIVAWNPDAIVERPVIAYQFIAAPELDADGETMRMTFQFTAGAEEDATAMELIGTVRRILTQSAFQSLSTPLDAYVERAVRRGFDLDVDLRVNRSSLIPA